MYNQNDYETQIKDLLYKKWEHEKELEKIQEIIEEKVQEKIQENQKLKIENKRLREELSLKLSTNSKVCFFGNKKFLINFIGLLTKFNYDKDF